MEEDGLRARFQDRIRLSASVSKNLRSSFETYMLVGPHGGRELA